MADRSVSVVLKAQIDQFKRSMRDAQESVKGVGDQTDKTSKQSTSALSKLASHARANEQAYNTVGMALVGLGAAAAAGVGLAVAKFADFDQAMSAVQAATHESAENMAALREAAIQAGADTQFSATEAAQAIEELAKAGISTKDILGGGLAGAMSLAAAGGLEVGQAAEIAATALTQFKLRGQDVGHVADLLAAGAGKAQGDVTDLAMALKQGGLVASQTGLSIEETTGALSAFAAAGLLGSDAGTSFKTMLQRLTPQSEQAAGLMEELGISAYDAQGNFVGLADFAGQLQGALKDLTPEQRNAAMATLFGADAVRAASVLYDQGEQGIREWIAAVDDQGFAAETARLKTDNLRGDIERLGGSLDTALIQTGSVANDVLRGLTQRLGAMVDVYTELPPAAQGATLAVGGTVGAVGLLGGGALLAIPKMVEFYDALGKMGTFGAKTQGVLKGVGSVLTGPWGIALAAGTVALGIWAEQQYKAAQYVADLSGSLDAQTGSISENTREIVKNDLAARDGWWVFQKESAFDAAEKLGLDLEMVTDAAMGNQTAMKELNAELERWDAAMKATDEGRNLREQMGIDASEWTDYVNAVGRVREGVEGNNKALDEAAEKTKQKAEADKEGAGAAEENAAGQAALQEAMTATERVTQEATTAIDDMINALNVLNGVGLSAINAQIAWEDSIRTANEALKENGRTLDISTKAGSANMKTLQGMASDAGQLAEAILRETGSEAKFRASLEASRVKLIEQAQRFGMTKAEAQAYADRVLSIPVAAQTSVQLEGAKAAMDEIDRLQAKINSLRGKTITINQTTNNIVRDVDRPTADGAIYEYADGGFHKPAIGAQMPQIQPNKGPTGIQWAETGAGPWEAFISGHPGKRDRSVAIWEQTGERLGLNWVRFADGGFMGSGSGGPGSVGGGAAPLVDVYVQAVPDGPWVRQQARVVVRDENAKAARSVASRRR